MSDAFIEKPYRIVFEKYPNYLYALVHGETYGYEVLVGFLTEIANKCKECGYHQVLIEENISAAADEKDVIRVASELPDYGYADIRLAYIDRFLDQKEMNEMGQDIAVDHGVDVRIFQDQAGAEQWFASSTAANTT